MADRMIAADGKRQHARIDDLAGAAFDVLVADFQPVAAAERHIADIGDAKLVRRCALQHMVVGADALDCPQRPRPEA